MMNFFLLLLVERISMVVYETVNEGKMEDGSCQLQMVLEAWMRTTVADTAVRQRHYLP